MKTLLLTISLAVAAQSIAEAQIDPARFSSMEARSIGPAGMSGRVAAVDAVVSDPNIIYVGAATGGVWKSPLSKRVIFPLSILLMSCGSAK